MPKDLASGDQQVELSRVKQRTCGQQIRQQTGPANVQRVLRLTKETTWAGAKKQPTINSSDMSVSPILKRCLKLFLD